TTSRPTAEGGWLLRPLGRDAAQPLDEGRVARDGEPLVRPAPPQPQVEHPRGPGHLGRGRAREVHELRDVEVVRGARLGPGPGEAPERELPAPRRLARAVDDDQTGRASW